ncbi:histidine phosphatase family protein [Terrisporobacter petrolearius]|uniref:histidine phosphatase family protein n=1 Tax=Terrisporobacter petrolearius TaxID=1460447 RepID=UPI003B00FA8D
MNIYLVRHGELYWEDNIKKCIGITDINLNEKGFKRAELVGLYLKDKNISKIYTSSLNRCKKSAEIISSILNVPYHVDNQLVEINMGIWENKSFDYIKVKYQKQYENRGKKLSTFRIKDGETFEECYERSNNEFRKLCEENYDNNIAILCHSGVIKSIICSIEKIPLDEILSIKLEYGHIIHINYDKKQYKIV